MTKGSDIVAGVVECLLLGLIVWAGFACARTHETRAPDASRARVRPSQFTCAERGPRSADPCIAPRQ